MKNINRTFKYMAVAAVALPMSLGMLTSCSNDENEELLARSEVKFTTAVSGAVESRADVAYAPAAGNLTLYFNQLGGAQKATYGYGADGWACTSTQPLYWEDLGGQASYTFYAVAPSAESGTVKADQSKTEDFVASDLLVARTTVDKAATPVKLVLKHLMGKMVVNVSTTEGENALSADELASTTVSIKGLKTAYTVTPGTTADVPATAAATGDADSQLFPNQAATAYSFIAPAQTLAGVELSFTVALGTDKRTYIYKVSDTAAPSLAAGTITTFNITINKTKLALGDVTVTDWAEGTTASATLTVSISGTADELTGAQPTFTHMNLFVAQDGVVKNYSAKGGGTVGTAYSYAKTPDGQWAAKNSPIFLDALTASSVLYALATHADAEGNDVTDEVTQQKDILLAGPVSVKGGTAAIQFRHAMAQMSVILKMDEGASQSLDGASLTTPAMSQKIDLVTDAEGTYMVVATDAEKSAYTLSDNASHLYVPQTLAANSVFTVTLKNGNAYQAKLSEDLKLEAGKKAVVTLTLDETAATVKATVTDWTEGGSAIAAIQLAGLTEGNGSVTDTDNVYTAAQGDKLTVSYGDVASGTYTYTDGAWVQTVPLYWDEIPQTGFTGTFTATLTPAAVTAPVQDVLTGIAEGVTYGGELSFSLKHSTAKLSFVFRAGKGLTDDELASITRKLLLGAATDAIEIGSDPIHLAPQTLTDEHIVTLTRTNGNQYTVKLADLVKDADSKLFADGKMEAGTHYTITLMVNETAVTAKAVVVGWNEAAASDDLAAGPVGVDDLSAITEAGTLTLTNVHDADLKVEYTNNGTTWTNNTPIYWDNYSQATYQDGFKSLFIPINWAAGDDYLYGTGTAEYGQNIQLTLHHAMAKMTIKIVKGENMTDAVFGSLTHSVALKKVDSAQEPNVNDDGTTAIDLEETLTDHAITSEETFFVAPQDLTDAHIITQTRQNGNAYTLKLADLKDAAGSSIFGAEGKIVGGNHYDVTLTVDDTKVTATVTLKEWNTITGSGEMKPQF